MRLRLFSMPTTLFVLLVLSGLLVFPMGCSDDDPTGPQDNNDPTGPEEIHVDEGDVGVVLDTRRIFKRGYQPLTAAISFADYPDLDTTLDVDQTTHYAILTFKVADLEADTAEDLANGTTVTIAINGPDKAVLAQYTDAETVFDTSNTPLILTTDLPFLAQPVVLEEGMAYLLQLSAPSRRPVTGGWFSAPVNLSVEQVKSATYSEVHHLTHNHAPRFATSHAPDLPHRPGFAGRCRDLGHRGLQVVRVPRLAKGL